MNLTIYLDKAEHSIQKEVNSMKKKKKTKFVIVLFLFLFLFIGITYAYAANQQNTATNVVTVGKVSIELINQDVAENATVSAGHPVSKIVKVRNKGNYAAYIRLKIKKEWTGSSAGIDYSTLSADAIEPDCKSDWVVGNGEESGYTYYYYQNILPAGSTVDFMDSYQISEEKVTALLKDYHGDTFSINGKMTVQAEAVQADYFDEQLTRNTEGKIVDWKEISFEGFQEDNATPIPVSGGSVSGGAVSGAGVEFVGSAGEFVSFKGGDDLFLNMKGMMPGQTVEQNISITNGRSNDTLRVYLYAQLPELCSEEDRELLKYLHVTVTEERRRGVLYDGILLNQPSEGKIPLGEYAPGDVANLKILLKLDPKWKKGSSHTKIQWIFTTENKVNPTSAPVNPGTNPERTNIPDITKEPQSTEEVVVTEEPTSAPSVITTEEPNEPSAPSEPSEVPLVTEEPIKETESTEKPNDVPMLTDEPLNEESTPKPTKTPVVPTASGPISTSDSGIVILSSESPKATKIPSSEKPKKTEKPDETEKIDETEKPNEIESNVEQDQVPNPDLKEVHVTKTGDATPIIFWMVLCMGSFIGIIGIGNSLLRFKKK